MSHPNKRRYKKSPGRRVVVFGEISGESRHSRIAKALTLAGLEQARHEAEAAHQHETAPAPEPRKEAPDA